MTGSRRVVDGGTTIAMGSGGDEVPDESREPPASHLRLEHPLGANRNEDAHRVQ